MAYTSFIIRSSVSAGGSALRRTKVLQDASNPNGSGDSVYDSGLKADGFIPAIPANYLESTFSANVYIRGEVELQWTLGVALVSIPAGVDYEPVSILIRGSGDGEPITANDGFEVIKISYDSYVESFTDVAGTNRPYIADGKWAYYSMFVRYEDNTGSAFYEKVASLSVQTPTDFKSTEDLWKRIPVYYRELDNTYAIETLDYPYENGPLYRYVELFGWELDKIRTTVYDTMRINDPQVVHSSAIDALAAQVGAEITKSALGTAKLRALLDNIGYLRRTKGTLGSIESYISALSGCGVSYKQEYAVGDVGPGGGLIFLTPNSAGNTTGKYFEAAPASTEVSRTWATNSNQTLTVTGADGTAVGTGYQNTLDIVAQAGNVSATSAAVYCDTLVSGGKSDWFLPSSIEMQYVYKNLAYARIGGFYYGGGESGYWTSTESTANSANIQDSIFDTQGVRLKSTSHPVRAIRMFLPTTTRTFFAVHPHRANIFSDPLFAQGITNTTTVNPYQAYTNLDEAGREYGWGIYMSPTTSLLSTPPVITVTGNKLTVVFPVSIAGNNVDIRLYSRGQFTYNNSYNYYASAYSSHSFGLRFLTSGSVYNAVEPSGQNGTWVDTWNDSVPIANYPQYLDTTNTGRKIVSNIASPTTYTSEYKVCPVYIFKVPLSATTTTTFTFEKPLVEYRKSSGIFFSGNEPLGGFLPDASGATGEGIYDYHWGPNAVSVASTDFSYYTLDFYRSKKVTEYVVDNYVVPVNMVKNVDYQIDWDVLE